VSTHATGAYRLTFTPEARRQWSALPADGRTALQRALEDLAWTVGLRQWVSEGEAQELFSLRAGPHEVTYRLDPQTRTLVVEGVGKR
jgi:mRNA-degrading endonuclease RelE of RelBE toxin-antitoxin system